MAVRLLVIICAAVLILGPVACVLRALGQLAKTQEEERDET